MFTGIIEELGRVKATTRKGAVVRLEIRAEKILEGVKRGDSISVDGVCLTVIDRKDDICSFEAIPETVNNTTLRNLRPLSDVNLERALKAGDRIGGHFVCGHVDYVGVIRTKRISKGNIEFQISLPARFVTGVIRKGSVAVDGISLTVADVRGGVFSVYLIPHTARVTTLGKKRTGDRVNVELDMLAKRR